MLAKKLSVLVVDNDETARSFCFKVLSRIAPSKAIRKISLAANSFEARRYLASEHPDLVFLDLKIDPGDHDSTTGLELLQEVAQAKRNTKVVVMTSSLDDEDRDRAQKLGALHFIHKPLRPEWIGAALDQLGRLKGIDVCPTVSMPISQPSVSFSSVLDSAERLSSTDLPVHFLGSSVDDRAAMARFVHESSRRASEPLVEYNCGWLDDTSCEAEIFGSHANPGLLASANGGTLFLDDIDLLPIRGQKMMASLIQSGTFKPKGARRFLDIDVRYITATSKDLKTQVDIGQFLTDLFYRIGAPGVIAIPELRDRPEDVDWIIPRLLPIVMQRVGKELFTITPGAVRRLREFDWPGNVEVVQSVLENALTFSDTSIIDEHDVAGALTRYDLVAVDAGAKPVPERRQKTAINELSPARKVLLPTDQDIIKIAAQVAHDIKSPLAALEIVGKDLDPLPEETRTLLQASIQRVKDIAQTLSPGAPRKSPLCAPGDSLQEKTILRALLEDVVREKQICNQPSEFHTIRALKDESYGVFLTGSGADIARVVSNLLNNAVEATAPQKKNIIQVSVRAEKREVAIAISDTGRGIPEDRLRVLGERGASFDKEGGSGLGLWHARETVGHFGGRIAVSSVMGSGTTVTVRLPRAAPPNWFVQRVCIEQGQQTVLLSNEAHVQKQLQQRFSAVGYPNSSIVKIREAPQAQEFVNCSGGARSHIWLLDIDTFTSKEGAFAFVERNVLQKTAIVMSNRLDDLSTKRAAIALGVKLLPKLLIDVVPVNYDISEEEEGSMTFSTL